MEGDDLQLHVIHPERLVPWSIDASWVIMMPLHVIKQMEPLPRYVFQRVRDPFLIANNMAKNIIVHTGIQDRIARKEPTATSEALSLVSASSTLLHAAPAPAPAPPHMHKHSRAFAFLQGESQRPKEEEVMVSSIFRLCVHVRAV